MGAIKQLLIAAEEGDREAVVKVRRLMGVSEAEAGCICLPHGANDQCSLHGYEAWKARRESDERI